MQGIVLYMALNLFWAQREIEDARLEGKVGYLDKGDEYGFRIHLSFVRFEVFFISTIKMPGSLSRLALATRSFGSGKPPKHH